jgi:short-subunit dehydrogenase
MKVDGKTALVTGATGGLGRAIARTLAAREARIVLSSRKTDELDELAESLPGGGHTTVVCDLADEDAALTLLEKAGDIDVLVANAALPGGGRAWRASANTRSAARFVSTSSRLCA